MWGAWATVVGVYLASAVIRNLGLRVFWNPMAARNMEEMRAWRYTTKDEMKHLGGTLIQMTEKLREFLLLGISKMVEDAFNNTNEAQGTKLDVWESAFDHLAHAHEVRWVRHLSNVIKHNNSVISSLSGSKSGKALVQQFGAPDDTPVAYLPEFALLPLRDVMLRYIYYAMTFGFALLDYTKLLPFRQQLIPHDDIPNHMLNRFVRDLPGHPERATNG